MSRPDRAELQLDFDERFSGSRLDRDRWVDHYLPHWTTPDRSAAHYDIDDAGLVLRVDHGQPAWRDEDGRMRVSNLQTGSFSRGVGSERGTHRHVPGMRVRTATATRALWTPIGGRVEATLEASPDPTCMLAIWLVGFEESSPDDSGEICVAELFGRARGETSSRVRLGVKAINDPRLRTDVVDIELPIDTASRHSYAAEWNDEQVRFFVDDALVHTSRQTLAYPLQLMLDLFEFPVGDERSNDQYPKTARVREVRGYRRATPAG